jgi:ATP-dependent Lon protease
MTVTTNQELIAKARSVFKGLVIDKQRLHASQLQKRGVPAYVGEWLLDTLVPGEGSLTQAESEKVSAWAAKFIPGPRDTNTVKNRLLNGETVKLLTPVQVDVDLQKETRFARLRLLDIDDAQISVRIVEEHPDLLRQGMWGVAELIHTTDGVVVISFRPMQATFNLERYKQARHEFTLEEWMDLVFLSMGFEPSAFKESEKLVLLGRLLPLVQKSMHLMELAPKATGKSYFFENVSPRVRLVSGGNISPAVLFVNNANGQWGLLARFSVVVLDEIQSLKFQQPEEIVGSLKGFLANGRMTRGGLYETSSDCSFVMLANVLLDEFQQPIVSETHIEHLPEFLQETAFLDRIRGLLPGWKIRKLGSESFTDSLGLKTDFFGEALLALREDVEIDQYISRRVRLTGEHAYKRNSDSVQAIASGMAKILFPHLEMRDDELARYCVEPAREYRQLIFEQLYHLDAEYRQWDHELQYEIVPK